MPFNGNLFAYEGFAKDDRWLEKDLARDAVAVAVADGSGCPDLRNNLLEPQVLYDELERMAADGATSDCMQYVDVYNLQLQAWTATVVSLLE
jgi:hypothetical protein